MMIEYRITLRPWLMKKAELPLRIWHGWVVQSTLKGVQVYMWALPGADHACMKCGRALTHPISQYLGIGPECGKHYYQGYDITQTRNLVAWNDILQSLKMGYKDVHYSGWLPQKGITLQEVGTLDLHPEWRVRYLWKGKQYQSIADYDGLQRLLKYADVQSFVFTREDVWGGYLIGGHEDGNCTGYSKKS